MSGNGTYQGGNEKIEELRASFVNSYCFSSGWYKPSENISESSSRLYLFNFYPYILIVEVSEGRAPQAKAYAVRLEILCGVLSLFMYCIIVKLSYSSQVK